MSTLKAQDPEVLYMQEISFAKEELERRRRSPVLVKAEDVQAQFSELPPIGWTVFDLK